MNNNGSVMLLALITMILWGTVYPFTAMWLYNHAKFSAGKCFLIAAVAVIAATVGAFAIMMHF